MQTIEKEIFISNLFENLQTNNKQVAKINERRTCEPICSDTTWKYFDLKFETSQSVYDNFRFGKHRKFPFKDRTLISREFD